MNGHLVRRVKRLSLRAGDILVVECADNVPLLERDAIRNQVYRLAAERRVENVGVLFLPGVMKLKKMPKSVRVAL